MFVVIVYDKEDNQIHRVYGLFRTKELANKFIKEHCKWEPHSVEEIEQVQGE